MNDYITYVTEQLSDSGTIHSRAMFGGYGIYKDGIIVGIVVDNELYFKTDKDTERDYQKLGSEPFTYDKNGKKMQMAYWKVPEGVLEKRENLHEFVMKAYTISVQSKTAKKK